MTDSTIIYTHTDEAPALATYSFLPVVQAYASTAGVTVETRDISLAGRIIASFPEYLEEGQRIDGRPRRARRAGQDARGEHHQAAEHLGVDPAAQGRDRRAAGAGLRAAGLPGRPEDRRGAGRPRPLRQGQGQRRQPGAARGQLRPPRPRLGQELRQGPPAPHGRLDRRLEDERRAPWAPTTSAPPRSPRSSPRPARCASSWSATTAPPPCCASPYRCSRARSSTPPCMRVAALREFLTAQIARAKAEGVLFSVHLKATMMKVSDPIIFGHVVRAFFPKTFAEYGETLAAAGLTPNDGLGGILKGLESLPEGAEIKASFEAELAEGPALAMVDSDQRHHQPARAERRHRRRLDAGHDPHLRPHVGPGRPGGRHPRGPPGQQLRRRLPGRHRRLPRERRLRPRRRWARCRTSA